VRLCIVGEGAFGQKHLTSLTNIDDVEVSWLVGKDEAATKQLAHTHEIPYYTCDLDIALKSPLVDAVILATPTPIHAMQAKQVMMAKKHVLIEIPMADSLKDAQALVALQKQTGVVAMAGHLRRFNRSHRWIHNKIKKRELKIQQLHAQTYFFRRENTNAIGKPRDWTDHLLWHHACHTVDLFEYQTQQAVGQCFALQGPKDPRLNIAMDMAIGMKVPNGAICTLSLSFNNEGPLGTTFRYICDKGTFVAKNDELYDGEGNSIDLSQVTAASTGVELIQREFVQAIRSGKEPNSSLRQCLSSMHTLHRIEQMLEQTA
jgi:2-hydroxy-4-carboxymuconate semialdehyde hemiacetal dehydrogenase